MQTMFLPVAKLADLSANLDVMNVNVLAEVLHSDQSHRAGAGVRQYRLDELRQRADRRLRQQLDQSRTR